MCHRPSTRPYVVCARSTVPSYPEARGLVADLEPGDVLYVPPLFYHFVETLTPSVSVSTWSHDYVLYGMMRSVYRHDHVGDRVRQRHPRSAALRMYIDMLLHKIYGFRQTHRFVHRMLHVRFAGLEHMWPPGARDDTDLCGGGGSRPGEIPTSTNMLSAGKRERKKKRKEKKKNRKKKMYFQFQG
jgi:hypothetical protein